MPSCRTTIIIINLMFWAEAHLAEELAEVGHREDGRLEASLDSSKCDIDIFGKDRHGRSALMLACENGLKGVVKYLLERGAEVDERYIAPKDDSYLAEAYGQTPLMIACKYGHGDVVKDLLASGADPNLACHHKGNTPLHYASMPSVGCCGEELPYVDDYERYTQLQKVDIVKSVLQHGAKLQSNNHGLSPLLYAAFLGMTEVVHFYIKHDGLNFSTVEKVEALEMCAVSLNIVYMHSDICSDDKLEKKQILGYEMLMKAKLLKCELSPPIPTENEIVSDLVALFGRGECKTVESLRMLENDRLELMVEAFLVSGRIFPLSLREEWLWKALLSFAHSTYLKAPKRLDKCKDVFSFCWRRELAGKLKFGTTLTSTFCDWHLRSVENDAETEVMICGALEVALGFLNILEPEHMAETSASIVKLTGDFLTDTLGYFRGEAIDKALALVEMIIKAVHSRLPHGFVQENGVALSFCHELIHTFINRLMFFDDIQEAEDNLLYKRMLHIICRFLFLEDASQRREDGSTMLHMILGLVCLPIKYFDVVILSQALIRHGCPLNADGNCKSPARFARHIAYKGDRDLGYDRDSEAESDHEEEEDENEEDMWRYLGPSIVRSDKYKELMSILTPGSEGVLRLEELATRTILRHRIRYRDVLPKPLHDVIEKGIYDVKLCEMEA